MDTYELVGNTTEERILYAFEKLHRIARLNLNTFSDEEKNLLTKILMALERELSDPNVHYIIHIDNEADIDEHFSLNKKTLALMFGHILKDSKGDRDGDYLVPIFTGIKGLTFTVEKRKNKPPKVKKESGKKKEKIDKQGKQDKEYALPMRVVPSVSTNIFPLQAPSLSVPKPLDNVPTVRAPSQFAYPETVQTISRSRSPSPQRFRQPEEELSPEAQLVLQLKKFIRAEPGTKEKKDLLQDFRTDVVGGGVSYILVHTDTSDNTTYIPLNENVLDQLVNYVNGNSSQKRTEDYVIDTFSSTEGEFKIERRQQKKPKPAVDKKKKTESKTKSSKKPATRPTQSLYQPTVLSRTASSAMTSPFTFNFKGMSGNTTRFEFGKK